MNSRRPLGWYLGLVVLVIVPVASAVVLVWTSSDQQIQVAEFYNSQENGDAITEEEYRYWDSLSRHAYQMVTVVVPALLTGAAAAIFALLAVLAFRWERGRQLAEVTAAS
jgi:hypothetical protein